MTLTEVELRPDGRGHFLHLRYAEHEWPRLIESRATDDWLIDIAVALAARHGLVQVDEGKWQRGYGP